MARKIRDAVRVPDGGRLVEIGPGTGKLTELLLETYPDLVAVEVDERAVAYLREEFPELDVREADVLELDWSAIAEEAAGRAGTETGNAGEEGKVAGRDAAEHAGTPGAVPLSVVGNLPYQITSPILFALIEAMPPVEEALLMMQEEVADRIAADPGGKTYGVTSVLLQLAAEVEKLFAVPPQVFVPPPKVTSAVVRLTRRPHPAMAGKTISFEDVREVVRTAFNQRRKMLRNSLEPVTERTGRTVPERWERARPEKLAPAEFAELTEQLIGAGPR